MIGIIVCGVFLIIGIILFKARNVLKEQEDVPATVLSAIAFVIAIGAFILSTFTIVPPGHRGIQTTLGTMNMEPLDEGPQFVNPLSSVTKFSIQNRVNSGVYECETSDTQTIRVGVSYNWRPNTTKLTHLIKDNGEDFHEVIIPPAMKECVKAEIARHKVSDITQQRHAVKDAIQETARVWLAKYDIDLLEMSVSEIDFSDKYDHAIEEKQVAEQEAQKALNILQRMQTEAKQVSAKAQGEADAKIQEARGAGEAVKIAAQAEADALLAKGNAQSEYNKKVAESLTPELIQRMWIERWTGNVPQFTGATNSPMFMVPLSK